MDKGTFVEKAPIYYAMAVLAFFERNPSAVISEATLRGFYTVSDDDMVEDYCFLQKAVLLDRAIAWLVGQRVISVTADDFGPPILERAVAAEPLIEQMKSDPSLPFGREAQLRDSGEWLRRALRSVNTNYDELGIQASDFNALDKDWEPLPLDRHDPQLEKAVAAIDETIEQVRGDNGYSANFPEERSYVLDGLSSVSRKLKESATVSVPYLRKYALEPLEKVIRRFKNAAPGIIATAARQALVELLKKYGIDLFHRLF
jgi:hypothetical protein